MSNTVKAARPVKAAKAVAKRAPAPRAVTADPDDVPAELRGFYDAPVLSRGAKGAAEVESLDFATPTLEQRNAVPMEKLFSIDGTDYFIPVEFGPGMGLIYLDGVAEGRDVALGRVLKKALGDTAWNALVAYAPYITGAQMEHLLDVTLRKTLGALEENGEGNG